MSARAFSVVSSLLLVSTMLGACSTPGLPAAAEICADPRPQVCTAIYDPVCAYKSGQADSPATYASDCSACADPTVDGYVRGACPE